MLNLKRKMQRGLQPLRDDRLPSRAVGLLATASVLTAVLAPRLAPLLFAAIVASIFLLRHPLVDLSPRFKLLEFGLYGFCSWGLIAAIGWSQGEFGGIGELGALALITIAALYACRNASHFSAADPSQSLSYWLYGLITGLIAAGAIILFELVTDQLIYRTVLSLHPSLQAGVSKHIKVEAGWVTAVSINELNRRVAVFSALLIPGLYAARLEGSRLSGRGLIAIAAAISVLTSHQSSQLALGVALILAIISLLSQHAAWWCAVAGWSVLVLLTPFIGLTLERNGLATAPWLFESAKGRVIIWGYTAEQILKRPFLGVGPNATRTIDQRRRAEDMERPVGYNMPRRTLAHPHNSYLQVWYELGFVGASFLYCCGLAILGIAWRCDPVARRFFLAFFTCGALLPATSFSLWSEWLTSAIAIGAVLLALIISGSRLPATDRVSK